MHLTNQDLQDKQAWQKAGIQLPQFNREQVAQNTKQQPTWVHFGAGNIFKAFPAMVQQQLLNQGIEDKGIIVAEGYDYEIIDKMSLPHDNLSLLVTLKADGSIEKTVVGSVVESLKVDSNNTADFTRLKEIFAAPSLQMVSFTITEKGYSLVRGDGSLLPDVEADFAAGPATPQSYIGKLAALCVHRYNSGKLPVALVSMDNCSHNGTKLYEAVHAFAVEWAKNGFVQQGFVDYIENPGKVSFPWSMIDKITPRPDEGVKEMLNSLGFEDAEGIVTTKNTYVAPFVNAEETQYLVIEDQFPNGRPALDKGGILFTTRETVDKVEKMKVCTCLNPLHTALAIYGCLLGYTKISDEMKDADLVNLIRRVGYQEGLPVVVDPGVLSPKEFIDTVIEVRLPNPFMPDTPQRIATDTSQKLSIRFGETIKAYEKDAQLDVQSLVAIPLVLAGWCRYLMGVDDAGNAFEVSPDPMYNEVHKYLADIKVGQAGPFHTQLQPILSNQAIFGVNLYNVGLGERVEDIFAELVKEFGAIRSTLRKYLV
ncbi:mannitol dehydrogenase family protein [Ruminococcaceae bacterium OttesenSCG-928-A16]|nr:mannitol dehydrogenase family protein [Ruminococcaceae bacterium OttesenSCG-928-A16]